MNEYEKFMLEDTIEWAKNIKKKSENAIEIIKIKKADFDNLKQENQQLKELLKECKDVLLSYSNISGDYELYDKITNAIGEKK